MLANPRDVGVVVEDGEVPVSVTPMPEGVDRSEAVKRPEVVSRPLRVLAVRVDDLE